MIHSGKPPAAITSPATPAARRPTVIGVAPARGACAPTRPGLVDTRYRLTATALERYTEIVVVPRSRGFA